jgi:hypothetical protein
MKSAILSAAILCLLGTTPAAAKSPCAEDQYKRTSDVARAGVKALAPPGAKGVTGKFYDASQCLSVNGGKKIREWAAEKRQEREDRKKQD